MDDRDAEHVRGLPARLVVVRVGMGSSGVAAALARLEDAARAGGRFAVLIDARGPDDAEGSQPGRVEQVRRLRALRPAMQERAAGVAFVVPPAQPGRQRKRVRAARLMLGCPVEAFDSDAAARRWLADGGVEPGEPQRGEGLAG